MQLSLGTVQLGVAYGVNNAVGALTDEQAAAVLEAAADSGFTMLDTSTDYGLAIERIGRFLQRRPGALEVVAKFDALLPASTIEELEFECVKTIGKVDYTLLWTAGGNIAELDSTLADGVTVYTVEEAEAVPDGFGMVQVPASMLDGRMDVEIRRLQNRGKIVLVRSLLLQGLLAADPETGPVGHHNAPELAEAARPYLTELRATAQLYRIPIPEMAVRWAWEIEPDVAIVGAETPEQVREIAAAWKRGPLPRDLVEEILELREGIPEIVISPRMWRQAFDFTLARK